MAKAPAKPKGKTPPGRRKRRAGSVERKAGQTPAAKRKADAAAKRAKDAGAVGSRQNRKGARLTGAAAALRDSMIIARAAQRIPWPQIAAESGLGVRQCHRVVEHARQVPSPIEATPMQLLEALASGFARDIADLEAMAFAWAEVNQAASLGAKKAVSESRKRLADLLAEVGKLPSNLELFRSEMEMQRIADEMVAQLVGVREGDVSPEAAIEFFRGLVVRREQARLTP